MCQNIPSSDLEGQVQFKIPFTSYSCSWVCGPTCPNNQAPTTPLLLETTQISHLWGQLVMHSPKGKPKQNTRSLGELLNTKGLGIPGLRHQPKVREARGGVVWHFFSKTLHLVKGHVWKGACKFLKHKLKIALNLSDPFVCAQNTST